MTAFRIAFVLLLLGFQTTQAAAQQNPTGKLPIAQLADPYLLLVRDPLVHRGLELDQRQQQALQSLNDELDGRLWTTRNQAPDKAQPALSELSTRTRQKLQTLLSDKQRLRLDQFQIWVQGMRSIARPDIAASLRLSSDQVAKIQTQLTATQDSINHLQKRAQDGEPVEPLEQQARDARQEEQRQILAQLSTEQRQAWSTALGSRVDVAELGVVRFKAPEFVGQGPWFNSSPLKWGGLKGKVAIVHFWTFGCINCIHNYPSYLRWQDEYAQRDVVMIGIHTPELPEERDSASVQKKAAGAQLRFPILVDNEQENWNAWGNSIWPAVYVVDKQGYVRAWWLGELNWQGAEGEKMIAKKVAELLAE